MDDPEINSIPEVVDIKKAFKLIDKGIAWGDGECKEILEYYCSKISFSSDMESDKAQNGWHFLLLFLRLAWKSVMT